MRRRFRFAVPAAVAGALLTPALVPAQVQKAADPAPAPAPAPAETRVVAKKQAIAPPQPVPPARTMIIMGPVRAQAAAVMPAPAPPVAIGGGVVPDDDGDLDPLVQQFTPQFRPTLTTELRFVRSVCRLTKDQRKQIDREGERALTEAATGFARMQQRMMRGRWRGNEPQPNPQKIIQDGLAAAVKAHLSADQSARYQEELKQRAEDHKRVAVRNLVAKLDQDLVLTVDQRNEIGASLRSHWNDAWCPSPEMLLYNDQFFPSIPDQFVTPYLNPTQRTVWHGMMKNQGGFFGGVGVGGGVIMMEDDAAEVEEPAEAVKADAGRKEKP